MRHTATRGSTQMLLESATGTTVRYGTVVCEAGLELVDLNGFICLESPAWVTIYADIDLPAEGQPHTLVPIGKVVRIEVVPPER